MKKILLFGAALMMAAVSMAQTPTVSASKVTMKYCQTSYGTVPIKTNSFPVNIDGFSFAQEGTYVRKLENVRGCDSVVTYVIEDKKGRLNGEFSVASGKKVQFSVGLLQFRSSNGTAYPNAGSLKHQTVDGEKQGEFRFAANQYTTIGSVSSSYSANSTGWKDIFSRGSSGNTMNPWEFSNYSSNIAGTNNDWGVYNAISNGGNQPGLWRCLTMAEYKYLLGTCDQSNNSQNISPCRANAAQKWGWATLSINNTSINGLVILPDEWTLPSGCSFTAQSQSNSYNAEQWAKMEENGAVFLPTTGYYQNNGYRSDATESWYNTADTQCIWGLEDWRIKTYSATQSLYCFVRLVMDVQ